MPFKRSFPGVITAEGGRESVVVSPDAYGAERLVTATFVQLK